MSSFIFADYWNQISIAGVDVHGGALDVHDSDIHDRVVNTAFHRHLGVDTTIAVAATAGDVSINVDSVVGFSVGDSIQLQDRLIESTFPVITAIASPVMTLDRPIDNDLAVGVSISQIETNMIDVGTLGAPLSYKVIPPIGETWHVISFILSATFAAAATDDKFGGIAALTNGVVLRGYNATADLYKTLTVWKDNSDIKLDMYDVPYTDKAGPSLFGMNGNGDIRNRTRAVPKIDGTAGDFMEILIQDDLSTLSSFRLKLQGHIELDPDVIL